MEDSNGQRNMNDDHHEGPIDREPTERVRGGLVPIEDAGDGQKRGVLPGGARDESNGQRTRIDNEPIDANGQTTKVSENMASSVRSPFKYGE